MLCWGKKETYFVKRKFSAVTEVEITFLLVLFLLKIRENYLMVSVCPNLGDNGYLQDQKIH